MADRSWPLIRLRVVRKHRLSGRMIRIVAGGEGIKNFRPNGFTDACVRVLFPQPGVRYPESFNIGLIKTELPRQHWPAMRSYTVRYFDGQAGELALDVAYHGDVGLAGPWAVRAKPGDEVLLAGPGGAYAPSPEADWHLLIGDESALPAIAVTLEAMPSEVPVYAFIEVADPGEEQPLATKSRAQIRWLHRSAGDNLVSTVRALDFPRGTVQAFVRGEAGVVQQVRRFLLDERGVPRNLQSVSGYWRSGKTYEQWRAEKAAVRAASSRSALDLSFPRQ